MGDRGVVEINLGWKLNECGGLVKNTIGILAVKPIKLVCDDSIY